LEDNPTRNIFKRQYKDKPYYKIEKQINGERLYYGSFNSLEQAMQRRDFLEDHQWDIKYACKPKCEKYIQKSVSGKYNVSKRINNNQIYYGTFNTLEEAREYRDFLEEHDWNPEYRKIVRKKRKHNTPMKYIHYRKDKNNNPRYWIQKSVNGEILVFGTYDSLEDAMHERDFWESINWDMNLLDLY